MLTDETRGLLRKIPKSEIYEFLKELSRAVNIETTKKYASNFVFIHNVDDYDDDEVVVMITSKEYFDREGYLEDTYYRNEPYDDEDEEDRNSLILELPYFLHECCESTYMSSLSLEDTKAKLIELGFEERFM